jgi:hypothetical protein
VEAVVRVLAVAEAEAVEVVALGRLFCLFRRLLSYRRPFLSCPVHLCGFHLGQFVLLDYLA